MVGRGETDAAWGSQEWLRSEGIRAGYKWGQRDGFKVGLHQGSALSSFLFADDTDL